MPYQYNNFEKAANYSLKTSKRVQKFYNKQINSSKSALANGKQMKKKCRLVTTHSTTIKSPKKNTSVLAIDADNLAHPVVANAGAILSHCQLGIKKQSEHKTKFKLASKFNTTEQPENKLDIVAFGQFDKISRNGISIAMNLSHVKQANHHVPFNDVNKADKLLAPPSSPTETGDMEQGDADKLMSSFLVNKVDMDVHSARNTDDLLATAFQRILTIRPLEQSSSNLIGGDPQLQLGHRITTQHHHKQLYKQLRRHRREIPFISVQPQHNPIRKKYPKSDLLKRNS